MYAYMNNEEIRKAMEKAISIMDWHEYLMLQEEADIRGI